MLLGGCGWVTVVVDVGFEWYFVLVYVSGLCGFRCLVGFGIMRWFLLVALGFVV